jgi:hypothetical protein
MNDGDTRTRLSDWFRQWRSPLRKFLRSRGAFVAFLQSVAPVHIERSEGQRITISPR